MTNKQAQRLVGEISDLIIFIAEQHYACLHDDVALDMAVEFVEKVITPILDSDG